MEQVEFNPDTGCYEILPPEEQMIDTTPTAPRGIFIGMLSSAAITAIVCGGIWAAMEAWGRTAAAFPGVPGAAVFGLLGSVFLGGVFFAATIRRYRQYKGYRVALFWSALFFVMAIRIGLMVREALAS